MAVLHKTFKGVLEILISEMSSVKVIEEHTSGK